MERGFRIRASKCFTLHCRIFLGMKQVAKMIYCVSEYTRLNFPLRVKRIGTAAHHMCVGSACCLGLQLSSQDSLANIKIDEAFFVSQPSRKVALNIVAILMKIVGHLEAKLLAPL